MLGLTGELSGNAKMIDDCIALVTGWEAAGTSEEKGGEAEKAVGGETQSALDKILTYLGEAIDLVCEYKVKLICTLTSSAKRYRRLLLQGKISRRRRWWFADAIWDIVSTAAVSVTNAVVSGVKAIGNVIIDGAKWVGKKASELGEYVLSKLQTIFQPVSDLFDTIKQNIVNYFTSNPLVQQAIKFFKCFASNGAVRVVKTLISVVKNTIELVPSLTTPAGWVNLLINLICGWKDLIKAVTYLKKAWKESDRLIKYNFIGKFTGLSLKAISVVF
jgi:hypothetical protein